MSAKRQEKTGKGYNMGRALRALREANFLSQDELAARAGLNSQTISNWENSADLPSRKSTIRKLAEYFGFTPEALLAHLRGESAPPSVRVTPRAAELIRDMSHRAGLEPDHWLEAHLEAMAKSLGLDVGVNASSGKSGMLVQRKTSTGGQSLNRRQDLKDAPAK